MTDLPDDTGTPRWVLVFGAVAGVALIVFAVVHLLGGGMRGHGPGSHIKNPAGDTAPAAPDAPGRSTP